MGARIVGPVISESADVGWPPGAQVLWGCRSPGGSYLVVGHVQSLYQPHTRWGLDIVEVVLVDDLATPAPSIALRLANPAICAPLFFLQAHTGWPLTIANPSAVLSTALVDEDVLPDLAIALVVPESRRRVPRARWLAASRLLEF